MTIRRNVTPPPKGRRRDSALLFARRQCRTRADEWLDDLAETVGKARELCQGPLAARQRRRLDRLITMLAHVRDDGVD